MADVLDDTDQTMRDARRLRIFVRQAQALVNSAVDDVIFSCENPPFNGAFQLKIPRLTWLPFLQAKIDAAQAQLTAVSAAAQAIPKVTAG